ncbi:MAG: RDD family protein [Candidatus Eiseniibacteriota bacterium]|nr:MAG: RDD family protein [Candidatus Eisenbacteria bacterium]
MESSPRDKPIYAGVGVRFLALLVDLAVFCAVFFPVTRVVKGVWVMSPRDHEWTHGWFITDPLCVAFFLVMAAYYVLLEGLSGATIGKRALGIRVVSTDGRRPGIVRGFLRNLLRLVDGLPALNILGVIAIVRSPERARIGDAVAKTRVVFREPPQRDSRENSRGRMESV